MKGFISRDVPAIILPNARSITRSSLAIFGSRKVRVRVKLGFVFVESQVAWFVWHVLSLAIRPDMDPNRGSFSSDGDSFEAFVIKMWIPGAFPPQSLQVECRSSSTIVKS